MGAKEKLCYEFSKIFFSNMYLIYGWEFREQHLGLALGIFFLAPA